MYKTISKELKVHIVELIRSHDTTIEEQSKLLGISSTKIYYWCAIYTYHGAAGLLKKGQNQVSLDKKQKIIREHFEKGVPLHQLAGRELVGLSSITRWVKSVREQGYDSLLNIQRRGRPPKKIDMARPKKKAPETELEILRYENERLRAENLLLKKVKALVEEREAQIRRIGRKPSKN